jgi:hypothetical protein
MIQITEKQLEAAKRLALAVEVLQDPDGELSCIPSGPEREEVEDALTELFKVWPDLAP